MKQKDTIREEYIEAYLFKGLDEDSHKQVDWWLNKLDQAYQAGAKDKVEEVVDKLEKSLEDLDSRIPYEEGTKEGIMHSIHLLKDNT